MQKKEQRISFLLILVVVLISIVQAPPLSSAQFSTYAGILDANFVHTPVIPYVNGTVTFDASTSKSGIGWIVNYVWNFGNNATGTGTITNTTYSAAGNYTVALTITDSEGNNDTESQMIRIIPIPQGVVIDLYNQKGGQGQNQPSEHFAPGEIVNLAALLTYNGAPVEYKLVGFIVIDPNGDKVVERTAQTDANGVARINFTIPTIPVLCPEELFGTWITATIASVSEQLASDTLTFEVKGISFDIYTQKPDPYSGKGPNMPSDAFAPQEIVILYGEVHYCCEPLENKFVGFSVMDPNGEIFLERSGQTNEFGIASINFTVPSNATFGIYTVVGTTEVNEETASDTLTFRVGWIIEIMEVKTVDSSGTAKGSFARGEHVYFNLTVKNIAFTSKVASFTVVICDEQNVPIGHVVLLDWFVLSGKSLFFIFDSQIPTWAYVGTATVYANAYTRLPTTPGTAYCPEASATFTIFSS